MTQLDRLLRHLSDYGSITSLEAMQEYGIMRTAARMADLKERGYPIVGDMECGKNRYGEPVHYTRYRLEAR